MKRDMKLLCCKENGWNKFGWIYTTSSKGGVSSVLGVLSLPNKHLLQHSKSYFDNILHIHTSRMLNKVFTLFWYITLTYFLKLPSVQSANICDWKRSDDSAVHTFCLAILRLSHGGKTSSSSRKIQKPTDTHWCPNQKNRFIHENISDSLSESISHAIFMVRSCPVAARFSPRCV